MSRNLRLALVAAVAIAAITISTVAAHGGGLDSNCGHAGSKPYHYHYGNCTPRNRQTPPPPAPTPVPTPAPAPAPAIVTVPIRVVDLEIDGRQFHFSVYYEGWPESCIAMNDQMELAQALLAETDQQSAAHIGNIGIYERVFGSGAEAACRADHRDDVRGAFIWAF